jgi:hypothetical protein
MTAFYVATIVLSAVFLTMLAINRRASWKVRAAIGGSLFAALAVWSLVPFGLSKADSGPLGFGWLVAGCTVLTAALRQLRDQVTAQFVARAEMVEAVLTALVASEHVFVYGPPGTAKSSVLRSLASGFGGKFFRIVLNPDTLAPRLRAAQVQVSRAKM